MRYKKIPSETIRRLPIYIRALSFLQRQGQSTVSSGGLAEQLNLNGAQIRKDFSYFGAFGTRGVGYNIDNLTRQIRRILRLDTTHRAVLVGAGRLGRAISLYPGFGIYSCQIAAVFDVDPKKIGKKIGELTVENSAKIKRLKNRDIRLAILAVPADTAQNTAEALVENGIKGILNLSPCYLKLPKSVKVVTLDIATELGVLPYYTLQGNKFPRVKS